VSIDVIDPMLRNPGIPDRHLHASHGPVGIVRRRCDVVGIPGQSVSQYFAVDFRSAFFGSPVLFEHDNARPLRENESVPVTVERTTGPLRLVVTGGERAGGRKARHGQVGHRGLGTPRDHDVRIPSPDDVICIPDAMDPGRTRRYRTGIRAGNPQMDRDLSRSQIDDHHRNEKRGHFTGPPFHQRLVVKFDPRQTPDARADIDTDQVPVLIVDLEPGILDCHFCRGQRIMDEGIHFLDILPVHPLRWIESLNFAAYCDRKTGRVETGNRTNPGASCQKIFPAVRDGVAERGDHPHARDNHSPNRRGGSGHHTRSLI
jgi:hypothetical protein